MVTNVIRTTQEHNLESICLSEPVRSAILLLREYLYEKVYYNSQTDNEFIKAVKIIKEFYDYYLEHPNLLPESLIKDEISENNIQRAVCDYIAGMTDRYALGLYKEIFFPKPWMVF